MIFIQLTGLSGAGKTTISNHVKAKLEAVNFKVEIIDGDCYRKTICKDLGFSKEDRYENIRRLAALSFDLSQKNVVTILSVINPYEEIRAELRQKYQAKTIFIDCDLNTVIKRDTKGLYKRAMLPENHPEKLFNLTGIDDVYEAPLICDLIIKTNKQTLDESVDELFNFVLNNCKKHSHTI